MRLTTRAFAEFNRDPESGRSAALQRATLDLMDDHSQSDNAHPAIWAPFAIVGETRERQPQGASAPPATASQTSDAQEIRARVRSFIPHENRDIQGRDFNKIANTTLPACINVCAFDPKCRALSFDKWNKWCFLKSSSGPLRLDPATTTFIPDDEPAAVYSQASEVMEAFNERYFPGKGYQSRGPASKDLCQKFCVDDKKCVAFTFYKLPKRCDLFSETGEYFRDTRADSGVKRQKPE